jgi:hypothetical protein
MSSKLQKIAEIRRLISGDDDRHKAYFFEGEAPEGYRPGKDDLIYLFDDEMEAKAKALNPGLFVGVTNTDTALELVQWLNDELPTREPMPAQPMKVQPMQPEAIEQPAPMPEPQPMEAPAPIQEFRPVTYPTRSPYRRTHI